MCGHCAHEKCAIGPAGDVWPCVLGRFQSMGNVLNSPRSEIWGGDRMAEVLAIITAEHGDGAQPCTTPGRRTASLRSVRRPDSLRSWGRTNERSWGRLRGMGTKERKQRDSANRRRMGHDRPLRSARGEQGRPRTSAVSPW
ncbi:SPASM domain-containing protein [Streptomyces sp. CWNU-52B]|uniref:SPASM domain-containing protein n=1 Tax=unclassified Streptomyces TaxID=2593676 RepID=UPI0039C4583B